MKIKKCHAELALASVFDKICFYRVKNLARKIFLILTLGFFSSLSFAQNSLNAQNGTNSQNQQNQQNSQDEPQADFSDIQILLPEFTTTVQGDSILAGKDSVLDFSNVLPKTNEISSMLPVLPQVDSSQEENVLSETNETSSAEKSIYLEGLLGGGYPGYFTGDFSIYKNSGTSPFLLRFKNESLYGYGQKSASDGFFDSNTILHGEKKITLNNFAFKADADYDFANYGLQSKSDAFYDLNMQTISTNDYAIWNLPRGFSLKFNFDGELYSRYGGIKNSSLAENLLSQETKVAVLSLIPSFNATWSNDFLSFDFLAKYNLESFLSQTEFSLSNSASSSSAIASSESSATTTLINRGEFNLKSSYIYDNEESSNHFNLTVLGGIVVGNQIGSVLPVIPRGILSVSYERKIGESLKPFSVNASGGLDSYLEKFSDLEKQFKFTTQKFLPSETSICFVDINSSIPILNSFTFDFDAKLKKPLWSNGFWETSYSQSSESALYSLSQFDDFCLSSEFAFSYAFDIFVLEMNYKSNWIHVPSNEYPHLVNLSFSYDSKDSLWGFEFEAGEGFGTNDYVPIINGGAYYRLKNSIRLAFELNDAVKLFSGKNRVYSSSNYEQSSGNVTLLVKFFF